MQVKEKEEEGADDGGKDPNRGGRQGNLEIERECNWVFGREKSGAGKTVYIGNRREEVNGTVASATGEGAGERSLELGKPITIR